MASSDEVFLLNNTLVGHLRHGKSRRSFAAENGRRPDRNCEAALSDCLLTVLGLFPMGRGELLGIEDGRVQSYATIDLGVFLAEDFFPIHVDFYQRGDPSASQFAVVGETNVLRLVRIAPVRVQQAEKQDGVLLHPELV